MPATRRQVILAVVGLVMMLLVPARAAQVTLTVMGAYPPGQTAGDVLEAYIQEYQRLNPHIAVEHLPRTGTDQEAMEQIYVRTAAGIPPDIVFIPQPFLTDYVVRDIVAPVPGTYADRIRTSYLPGALYLAEYQDNLYGFPTELMSQGLAYNSVVFNQAGLPDEAPQTWEELRDFARKIALRRDDGTLERAGYGIMDYATPVIAFILTYSRSHGGNPVSSDLRSVNFSEPQSVDSVAYLKALYLEDRTAVLGLPGWAEDKLGMFFAHGPWQAQGFRLVGPEFYSGLRSALPPAGPVGRVTTFYGYLWAVTPYTAHPQEAYDFLFWLSTEETERGTTRMGDVLEALGSIPVTPADARNQPSMQEPFMQGFLAAITSEAATPIPPIPAWLESFLELGTLARQAIIGELPEVEAMRRADQFIQLRIDEYYETYDI